MFNTNAFFAEYNDKIAEKYPQAVAQIQQIFDETVKSSELVKPEFIEYVKFFNHTAKMLLNFAELERNVDAKYFTQMTFEQLGSVNQDFFNEIKPENYEDSYANPTFCIKVFGNDFGQLMSYFYIKFRALFAAAHLHKRFAMFELFQLFVKIYNFVKNNDLAYEPLKKVITDFERLDKSEEQFLAFQERFSKDYKYFTDIVENADLNDLRYLYKLNCYITENEIKTAKFLADYPAEKIEKLANLVVDAYVTSFKNDKKDLTKKSTVVLYYNAGQERIIRDIIKKFREQNLEVLINHIFTTDVNKQYQFDHKFDNSLYLDAELTAEKIKLYEQTCEKCKDILGQYSGPVFFDKFGEKPFAPENKPENLKMSDEQNKLFQNLNIESSKIRDRFMPRGETSFSIIAFPSPEIGDRFEQIFEDTCEINMLENEKYARIQQHIIDALDKADVVHVKGKGDNQTDIKVKMQTLADPTKQTNFCNCVADVNIPVGEVFTSPKLTGTEGVLHLKETFLNGFKFSDLKLTFKDGWVSDYECKNYDDVEKNRKFIEENLLYPHKTLPIGEFAIGTNTLAYKIAQKHKIVDILPVLIVEKMGPHFAIGDTCFSWEEDRPVFNPDEKEITARENEKSAMRKTDVSQAYTNVHTDITLPYDGLDFIAAITAAGESIDIIRDGRFSLPGTEELNIPLDQM